MSLEMSLRPFQFLVTVEVERTEGKFASRDEIYGLITDDLEASDPGCISTGDSEYDIVSWAVEDYTPPKGKS